ncbi:MAG: 50S ribosomal protein L19 [Elusimicrobia bacterium]|nr:50S ribosomal protein L19 [Elusimicrobiota bacterium]
MKNLMGIVESKFMKKETTGFRPGDSVKVYYKIIEGDSERTQIYEGIVLRIKGSGLNKTVTIRKISFSIGVERVFLLSSPRLEKIELVKQGKVRRSRLYYLRSLSGKSARIEERSDGEHSSQGKAAAQQPATN